MSQTLVVVVAAANYLLQRTSSPAIVFSMNAKGASSQPSRSDDLTAKADSSYPIERSQNGAQEAHQRSDYWESRQAGLAHRWSSLRNRLERIRC